MCGGRGLWEFNRFGVEVVAKKGVARKALLWMFVDLLLLAFTQ